MQVSFFDGTQDFKFRKPIRLIEFFAGYGSQALALKELGVDFQHWRICEWAIKSIQAYKDNHFSDDNKDYAQYFTSEYIYKVLSDWGISSNYNEPLTLEQVKRLGEKECRRIYNNICITHNLVNISRVKGKDLQIEDTDLYDYVLTYSFPCQDLSKAGLGKGMARDSGTRSGLLWEVERILEECQSEGALPQILLMENVPDVIGTNNIKHFASWLAKLESLGYHCYWKVINSKDFGIPQNRDRCFMISILGDYFYGFPKEIKLENKLIDILETKVDEKYYLSQKAIKGKLETKFRVTSFDGCGDKHIIEPTLKEQLCDRLVESGLLKVGTVINHSYTNGLNGKNPNSRQSLKDYIESENGICNCLTTRPDVLGIAVENFKNLRIRKLTPKECFRLMGVRDKNFDRISKNQSNASLYHLAGDSIVVSVLVAILGQFVENFDFNRYIYNFYSQLKGE